MLLASALKENHSLTELNLSFNNIGVEVIKLLAEALKENNSLTQLDLAINQIGAEGIKLIIEALKENNSLTHLDLSLNLIRAEGIKLIIEALRENSSLTHLKLTGNQIGDDGARLLTEALKKNNSLIQVDLSSNFIEDNSLGLLVEVRSHVMTDIESIDNPNVEHLSKDEIEELLSNSGSNISTIYLGFGSILYQRCNPAKSARSAEFEDDVDTASEQESYIQDISCLDDQTTNIIGEESEF